MRQRLQRGMSLTHCACALQVSSTPFPTSPLPQWSLWCSAAHQGLAAARPVSSAPAVLPQVGQG